jgi:hypothetical protein
VAKSGILGQHEIAVLDRLFLQAHASVDAVRQSHALGAGIHYPKVPATLTESLVAHCLPRLLGDEASVIRGGRLGDLLLQSKERQRPRIVAVKGTGTARWITITASDLSADILVWVDYGLRIERRRGPVEIWVFRGAVRRRLVGGRLRLEKALAVYPDSSRQSYLVEPRTLRVYR